MPEAMEIEEPKIKEKIKNPKENDSKIKKSATSNGLGSFTKGKLVLARVNMLDGTVTDLSIEVSYQPAIRCLKYVILIQKFYFLNLQKGAKGQELIDCVCEQVDLVEKDYYGLVYVDQENTRNWLAADKKIFKQLKSNQ